jgi:hypothetical protein
MADPGTIALAKQKERMRQWQLARDNFEFEKAREIEMQVGVVLRAILALLPEAPLATCAAQARCTL